MKNYTDFQKLRQNYFLNFNGFKVYYDFVCFVTCLAITAITYNLVAKITSMNNIGHNNVLLNVQTADASKEQFSNTPTEFLIKIPYSSYANTVFLFYFFIFVIVRPVICLRLAMSHCYVLQKRLKRKRVTWTSCKIEGISCT